jgi:eukaryotic-like serine/threonine-protein kinase
MTTQPPTGGVPPSGPRVGGRYELSGLLGRGGMAEVREGRDLRLGRTVAVKRLRSDLANDSTFQARFRREAQSAASLNHPAIVAVYDTGEEEPTDGSETPIPYIVMEYVEGRTLREILRDGRKILPERALEITADVLAALDYSHRAGIVHRDIKPANVMLTPSGDVKVMDFGIARAVADSSSTMTQTAAVVGTAQYLSPEQARGEQVDARSDLYSTGVLLYELLTGRPPFTGDSPVAVAYQHVREEAPPPSTYDPEIPPELDAICAKALAKPTSERYQSATEMRADIERALAGQPVAAPAAVGAATGAMTAATGRMLPYGPPADDTSTLPPAEQEQRKNRRRGWLLALAALLGLVLLILAALFLPSLLSGSSDRENVLVPTVTGERLQRAERLLERRGLEVGDVSREADGSVRRGVVMEQDPEPGADLTRGSEVDLVVSSGPPLVAVPEVVGDQLPEAEDELESQGFEVETFYSESDEDRNEVLSVDPAPGERVRKGSTVTLELSDGLEVMPNLIGVPEDQARDILEERGIDYDVDPDTSSSQPEGIVSGQSPDGGSRVSSDDTVLIFVSTGPEEEPTPTPTPTPSPTPTPTPSPTPTEESPSPTPTEEEPTFPPTPSEESEGSGFSAP